MITLTNAGNNVYNMFVVNEIQFIANLSEMIREFMVVNYDGVG